MTDKFKTIVAAAKRSAVMGVLNRSEIEGLMRRAETLGIDQPEAARLIEVTRAAERINGRTGEVVS